MYIVKPSVELEESHENGAENNKNAAPSLSGNALPVAPDATRSTADRLLELKKLFDAGAITKDEYDEKRKVLVEKL